MNPTPVPHEISTPLIDMAPLLLVEFCTVEALTRDMLVQETVALRPANTVAVPQQIYNPGWSHGGIND